MNIPVFLASDNNYAPFVASTIASICDNTKSFIDIYVLDGGITKKNKEKICKLKEKFDNFYLEFIELDLEKEFAGCNDSGNITLATYSRFLIPQLKPNLSKVIYTDVDVVLQGDIAKMYNEDLEGYAIGAVHEDGFDLDSNIERKNRLGLSNSHKYFCAGNLLIDCKIWRDQGVLEQLMKIAVEKYDILDGHDQDVLNIYFEDNYFNLDGKYSYLTERHGWGDNPENMVIRHFTKFKPWEIHPNLDNSLKTDHHLFWHYIKMTEFYDECLAMIKHTDINKLTRMSRIRDMLLKAKREKYK